MALTPRQARFVDAYAVDRNGAAAARRAGYSAKSAKDIASRLLRLPHVAAALAGEAVAVLEGDPDAALTVREARFVVEYAVDLKAKAAAIRAGYSPVSADNAGRILKRPHVAAAVAELMAAHAARAQVDADRVLGELARLGFASAAELKGWGARVGDKIAALTQLGRHLRLFGDKVEHTVDLDLARAIQAARERARVRLIGGDGEGGEG